MYAAISAAAGCRIAATFISGNLLLTISAACWSLAFLLFVLRYAAVLSQPRAA
ncbi:NnrS family protein [Herbaspirillum frisingense]|uniref:NnrS family protein n=1 Tax=Herbaspirillum frisingense TaxID=92645 RepID=UPI0022776E51|nr:NnrS family protein [Herbaspirillum frisingense]UIN23930.1 NnrS family protein [Herbaspirillum frisingense]